MAEIKRITEGEICKRLAQNSEEVMQRVDEVNRLLAEICEIMDAPYITTSWHNAPDLDLDPFGAVTTIHPVEGGDIQTVMRSEGDTEFYFVPEKEENND